MQGCGSDGVVAWQLYDTADYPNGTGPLWPAQYLISDNTISPAAGTGEGIYLEDDAVAPGSPASAWGAPSTATPPTAPTSVHSDYGNNISGVTALPVSAGGPGAAIWVGPGTAHCLVVGGPWPTTVLNQGSGNILINVKKM